MARSLALALALWLSAGTYGAQEPGRPPSAWAVVVGVDQYQSEDIPGLGGAVADAKAIADVLTKFVGVPADHLSLLVTGSAKMPTADAILDEFEAIRKRAQPDDLMVFFFAGHGIERDGQQFLLTYDTKRDPIGKLKTSSLPSTTLMIELQTIRARNRIVMIDACRNDPTAPTRVISESFEREYTLREGKEGGMRATFLSAMHGQSAYEMRSPKRGYFSYIIEQGLSGAAASPSGDGVTVWSLGDHVMRRVPRKVREELGETQTPLPAVTGDFILVPPERLPVAPPPAPPPPNTSPMAAPRAVFGFVTNAKGEPLPNATIMVKAPAPIQRSLGTSTPDQRSLQPALNAATTNAEGFYTLDGLPGDRPLEVVAVLSGYQSQTVTTLPVEAGKMTRIVLPLVEPASSLGSGGFGGLGGLLGKGGGQVIRTRATELANVAYQSFLAENFAQAQNVARETLALERSQPLASAVLSNVAAFEAGKDASKLADARTLSDEALRVGPTIALAHNARGLVYLIEGDLENAQKEFQRSLSIDKTLAVAHANLAETYLRRGRNDDAEKSFRTAIKLSPDTAIPYNGLATVLFNQRKYGDAVKQARQAIARYELQDDTLGRFYANLATALFYEGKLSQAMESVAQAKRLGHTSDTRYEPIEAAARKAKGGSGRLN